MAPWQSSEHQSPTLEPGAALLWHEIPHTLVFNELETGQCGGRLCHHSMGSNCLDVVMSSCGQILLLPSYPLFLIFKTLGLRRNVESPADYGTM